MENEMLASVEQSDTRVQKGQDGNYYWLHELKLFRNPVFLLLMWKITFFAWLGMAMLVAFITGDGDLIEGVRDMALPMLIVLGVLFALMTFSYFLYALLMGGKYSVLFTMDEYGVTHTQLPKQVKRTQKIAAVAILIGLGSKSPGALAAGLNAAVNSAVRSDFRSVRSVKANPRRSTINLRSRNLKHSQVYTAPEDFDFVLDFIRERVEKA